MCCLLGEVLSELEEFVVGSHAAMAKSLTPLCEAPERNMGSLFLGLFLWVAKRKPRIGILDFSGVCAEVGLLLGDSKGRELVLGVLCRTLILVLPWAVWISFPVSWGFNNPQNPLLLAPKKRLFT